MGLYSNVIFPRILDLAMRDKNMAEVRTAVLADVTGDIFEIGFGTGLNLRYYPDTVKEITTVDANAGCNKIAEPRIAKSPITVHNKVLNGEELPMDDQTFDSVVCTWTLCSIDNAEKALGEIRRILRPDGKFFFVEHGLSPDPKLQKWQNRLNPIWKIIGDGCNLNRKHDELLQDCQFSIDKLDNFHLETGPKFATYLYQGVASKA